MKAVDDLTWAWRYLCTLWEAEGEREELLGTTLHYG
jgi:hypothetical protein